MPDTARTHGVVDGGAHGGDVEHGIGASSASQVVGEHGLAKGVTVCKKTQRANRVDRVPTKTKMPPVTLLALPW